MPKVPLRVMHKPGLEPVCIYSVGREGRMPLDANQAPLGHRCVLPRCVQGLQQGLLVWRQEVPSEFDVAYADPLLDISMLRLFETFLETTPQLTLVLAIILQSGSAEATSVSVRPKASHRCPPP